VRLEGWAGQAVVGTEATGEASEAVEEELMVYRAEAIHRFCCAVTRAAHMCFYASVFIDENWLA
jgi:hypothetical protein